MKRPADRPLQAAVIGDANPPPEVAQAAEQLGRRLARLGITVITGGLGGGAGTLSEICFAWIHGRPILLWEGSGGWTDRLEGAPLDSRASSTIHRCRSLDEIERVIRELFGDAPSASL